MSQAKKSYEGKVAEFKDGRKVTVCNNGEDFVFEFVNLQGELTGFRISPEAAEMLAFMVQQQLSQVGIKKE